MPSKYRLDNLTDSLFTQFAATEMKYRCAATLRDYHATIAATAHKELTAEKSRPDGKLKDQAMSNHAAIWQHNNRLALFYGRVANAYAADIREQQAALNDVAYRPSNDTEEL